MLKRSSAEPALFCNALKTPKNFSIRLVFKIEQQHTPKYPKNPKKGTTSSSKIYIVKQGQIRGKFRENLSKKWKIRRTLS